MSNWRKFLIDYLKSGGGGFLRSVDGEIAALPVLRALSSAAPAAGPLVAVVPDAAQLDRTLEDLKVLAELAGLSPRILVIPEAGRGKLLFPGVESRRARALDAALREEFDLVIGGCHALLGPAPSPDESRNASLTIVPGMTIAPEELASRLVALDYDDEYEATTTGEFARRGGIIDIFSPAHDFPCRVEFFGDEVESLRSFDPATQRSTGTPERYEVIGRSGITAGGAADSDAFAYFEGKPFRLLIFHPADIASLLGKYAAPGAAERLRALAAAKLAEGNLHMMLDAGELPPDLAGLPGQWQESGVQSVSLEYQGEFDRSTAEVAAQLAAGELRQRLAEHLRGGGSAVCFACHREELPAVRKFVADELRLTGAACDAAALTRSFVLAGTRCAFIAESTLVAAGLRLVGREPAEAELTAELPAPADAKTEENRDFSLADLEEGDYVVHLDHGIGIFRGSRVLKANGVAREVLVVEYRDEKLLYVPLLQAAKLSRYLGAVGRIPLHAIGGSRWKRDQENARGGVRSYAAEMLRFQAVRQSIKGLASAPDTAAMESFLRAFPYHDTRDQLRASAEIARDMHAERPMDRLLCGDVGYGKTELAMRAAFRSVASGFQVAVLAPTTVLAQQHYRSFTERFAGFPVRIGVLSRFRTAQQQARTIAELAAGEIDIVIGTHRLCAGEVRFRNLGLVVIDEEQRFGVEHKERLRRFRTEADVLSMSATPIPRTLYLAMAGARDLSTLMTPPKLRLPVKTVIAPRELPLVVGAIRAELARGGQVYYLHNRVRTIEDAADELRRAVPGATFAVAHGQMRENELEEVMERFLAGAIDVLVCSTIIESGLDVPNANTIIIEHAERFGLAELYQLRGRVGRWKNQAYAYMLLPKRELIGTDARKRLAAIRRCSNLGAGFQLALHDLEIRGSGNLLGAEQSGHLNAIGFELYCQLLRLEIRRMSGQEVRLLPDVEPAIDFVTFGFSAPPGNLAAAIPPRYIGGERLRIAAYRKLASLESEAALEDFRAELVDRFGKLPAETENLLEVTRLKILAALAGYRIFTVVEGRVTLRNPGDTIYRLADGCAPSVDYRDPPRLRLVHLAKILRDAGRKTAADPQKSRRE